jgi:hypothetical protein
MSIHIKPSHKGLLHKNLGVKQGEPIPASKLKIKSTDSPAVKKRKQFAINAKHFHHAKEGIDLQDPNYGNIAEGALTAIDMLPPTQNIQQPVIRPIVQTNPLAYGNNSQAIFKKGGKIMYDKGGKTEEKAISLNMNKRKTNPDLYSPFGNDAQLAYDEGWYPATGKTSSGQVIYNSDYDLLNNVMTPRKSNKGIPAAGGRVQLVGNGNGIFDVNVTDVDGQIFKTLAKGVPFNEANKFITKPSNIVQGRSNQIVDQTTAIPLEPTAKAFGDGGKLGLFNTNKKGYVDSVLNANMDKEWVRRLYETNPKSIQIPGQPYTSTHFMESGDGEVYPTVVNKNGNLQYLGKKARAYADSTNTAIKFPDDNAATWFGENYKMGTGVLPKKKNGGKMAKNGMEILDDSTVEFHGDKHSDPSGGIPMAAHGKQVLVEDGETAQISPMDNSVTIMGNLKNPLTGNKYKNDSKFLAEKQAKVEGYIDEGVQLVNDNNPQDKWGALKFNSGKAMMQGGTFKKNIILQAKEHLSDMQQAHLEIAHPEMATKAKYGIKLAENGKNITNPTAFTYNNNGVYNAHGNYDFMDPSQRINFGDAGEVVPINKMIPSTAMNKTTPSLQIDGHENTEAFAPTDAKGLSFNQILPELYSAATNKQEGVFSQNFTPELYNPYSVSFQDRRNAANSQFRASTQYLGDNPAAQASLAGQTYENINNANADEFRTNQGIFNDIENKNVSLLNEAKSKNLGIADTQYLRQQQAKSNTKAQNATILQSISSKIHQNQLEQSTIQLYENLYNYRFGKNNKAQNYNSNPEFVANVGTLNSSTPNSRVEQTVKNGNTSTKTITEPSIVQKMRAYQTGNEQFKLDRNKLNSILSYNNNGYHN